MASTFRVNSNVPCAMGVFLERSLFCDFQLVCSERSFACHRIVLARASSYFRRLFSNPNAESVELPFRDDAIMESVLNFIYMGKLSIEMDNLAPLMKSAIVYEIDSLLDMTKFCCNEYLNDDTAKKLTKSFVDNGLEDEARVFVPYLAKELADLLSRKVNTKRFFSFLSLRMLAAVLKETRFPCLRKREKTIIALMDAFVGDRVDCETVDGLVDWTAANSYKYFARYKLFWVPVQVSRKLMSQLIDERRKGIASMRKSIDTKHDVVGRWFGFSWMSAIANGIAPDGDPVVNVIDMLSTLGKSTNRFNIAELRFVNVTTSPPMHPDYKGSSIFSMDDRYYMSSDVMYDNETNWVSLDFGTQTHLSIRRISVNSDLKTSQGMQRPAPSSLLLGLELDGGNVPVEDAVIDFKGHASAEVMFGKGGKNQPGCCEKVKFTMMGEAQKGGCVMRVKQIELVGAFE